MRANMAVNRALDKLLRYREERAKEGKPARGDDVLERALVLSVQAAADCWTSLRAAERGARDTGPPA